MATEPFRINVPQAILDDLNDRLAQTRWPDEIEHASWDYGTSLTYLKGLTDYWQHEYDWRKHEADLNEFSHFRASIDGTETHFIHEKGRGAKPLPLLLTHGWPDSFYRFYKVIPMLTDPERFGGSAEDSFDVVVPSIPGYGFSDTPLQKSMTGQLVVDMFAHLMTKILGYEKFAAHGGDVGSGVTERLARNHAASLIGIHLTDIPYGHIFTVSQEDLSETERAYLEAGQAWQLQEGAYGLMQSTKPQTAAYGLNDSPVGLAAWMVEKFRAWSDCDGDVEQSFTKDELLTNVTLYWATQTIGSSFLPYIQGRSGSSKGNDKRIEVPTGVSIFPKDIVPAPRDFGERFFNIQHWTEMPKGGHFAALEEPELFVDELRDFFRPYR